MEVYGTFTSGYTFDNHIIYIIITENIRYLLWNQGLWRSLNNTYPIFLTPCLRCTKHLCDSCDLTDVNRHFIPSLLRMVQNVDLLWRHRYKSRSPASVTSQWPIVPAGCYRRFLSTMMRTVVTAQWATENISCFNFLLKLFLILFCDPRVSTRGIADCSD